jgi:peptidoglycan/xylan/chitin deacetylase (PgdA/CDA1 family)
MGLLSGLRRAGLRVCTLPGIRRLYRPLVRDAAVIFMLHRFADPERGVFGTEPAHLAKCLGWLRRRGRPLLDLENLVRRWIHGKEVPAGAVCFTVDDAYYDFFTRGLDVFVEHDCPVTVFVPTGFLAGDGWLWWDRVGYVLQRAEDLTIRSVLAELDLPGHETPTDRANASERLLANLERVSEPRREAALRALSEATGVAVPAETPPSCRPMTWDQVRSAEQEGIVRFAPHSLTHPVLSRTSSERLLREISGSWRRLREETERPVPIFAYPGGAPFTFGPREERAVREAGLMAAVSARPEYLGCLDGPGRESELRWRLPRFGLPSGWAEFVQIASGLLRLRQRLRDRQA